MNLMKEYASLATAAIKMGKIHFYSYHASLGNSMLNHTDQVTLTSPLPVVGIIEI